MEKQRKQHDVVLRSRKEVEKLAQQHGKATVATNKPDSQKTTPRNQAPGFSIGHNNEFQLISIFYRISNTETFPTNKRREEKEVSVNNHDEFSCSHDSKDARSLPKIRWIDCAIAAGLRVPTRLSHGHAHLAPDVKEYQYFDLFFMNVEWLI